MFKQPAKLACVVALVLSGCGGGAQGDMAGPEEALTSSEQNLLYACDGRRSFHRYWYENNVEIGWEYCECDGTLHQTGVVNQGRYTQQIISYCNPFPPGSGG